MPIRAAPQAAPTIGSFSDRRVDHAARPELIDDSLGDFEGAAIGADIFHQSGKPLGRAPSLPRGLTDRFNHRGQPATRRPFELVFLFLSR